MRRDQQGGARSPRGSAEDSSSARVPAPERITPRAMDVMELLAEAEGGRPARGRTAGQASAPAAAPPGDAGGQDEITRKVVLFTPAHRAAAAASRQRLFSMPLAPRLRPPRAPVLAAGAALALVVGFLAVRAFLPGAESPPAVWPSLATGMPVHAAAPDAAPALAPKRVARAQVRAPAKRAPAAQQAGPARPRAPELSGLPRPAEPKPEAPVPPTPPTQPEPWGPWRSPVAP